jgi:nucleotide-binding universal stress UspA family protein
MKKARIKNILVPVDFSKMSIQAIGAAKNLAERFGGTIHLVHIYESFYPAGFVPIPAPVPTGVSALAPTMDAQVQAKRQQDLKALATRFGVSPKNCYLRDGAPVFEEICWMARDIGADLIVTPTHGRTGLKHIFLGSTAERVVQHSPCPVFVYRKGAAKIDRILVPVDFSACALEALKEAIAFADRVAAKVVVMHAVDLGLAFTSDGYGMYDLTALIDATKQSAEDQMRSFVRKAKFGGVKFETSIKVGPPVNEIFRVAETQNVDLIITATHGRTGFERLLMGSVAEQIVRHAPRSVLVIPSHPAERSKRIARVARRQRPSLRDPSTRVPAEPERFTKRFRKLDKQPFPERRKTNKFRESHQLVGQ